MSRRSTLLLLTGVLVLSLAALAVPTLLRARGTRALNVCVNNLRVLAAAKEQWALEYGRPTNEIPTWDDVRPYLGRAEIPLCPDGGAYRLRGVGEAPSCSMGGPDHSLDYDDTKERRFRAVAGSSPCCRVSGCPSCYCWPRKRQTKTLEARDPEPRLATRLGVG